MPNKKIFLLLFIISVISGCGVLKTDSLSDQRLSEETKKFQAAEKAFQDKNYDKSEKLLKEFITKYEKSDFMPQALLKYGLINEKKDSNFAFEIFSRIISEHRYSDEAVTAAVYSTSYLNDNKKFSKAESVLTKLLKTPLSDNNKIRLLYPLAATFSYQDKYLEAVKTYNQILKTDPGHYERIRPLLSVLASNMHEEELLKASSVIPKNDAAALFKKFYAISLLKKEKTDEAKNVFNKIIKNYPDTRSAMEAKQELEKLGEKNRFSIGVILPLSGKFKNFGEMGLKAVQLAVSNFTDSNPDIKIKLFIEDNKSSEEGAKKAAEKLCQKKVSAIIGPFHTAEPAAAVAQESSVPIMVMTHDSDITKNRNFVFRNFITQSMQAEALVSYAKDSLKINNYAIFYPDEPYGEKFMNAFWDAADRNHSKIKGVEKYNPDSADYTQAIRKLTGLYHKKLRKTEEEIKEQTSEEDELEPVIDFDAIFIPDGPLKSSSIAPQLAYFDVKDIVFLGPNLWKNRDIVKNSEGYIKKAYFTSLYYNKSTDPVITKFTNSYEAVFGVKPEFVEAISYDSAMFIFNAAKKAGSASSAMLRDSLVSTSVFSGVTGKTFFDLNGECSKEIIILEADKKGYRQAQQKE
jgi:ABC-type branched-subunit amino acid transport system substrate-binding protein